MTKARESSRSHFDHLDTDRDNRVRVAELIGYITEHFRISYGEAVELVSAMRERVDVDPDPDSSSPTLLASVGNTLVFTAYDGKKRMLYALTGGGTPEPLREVTSDPQLILAGDHLYGLVQSSEGTFFVSIADGGGITNFRDADPAHAFTGPSQFTEAGGSVYYVDYLPAVSKKVVWKIVDSSHLVPVETQMDHVGQIAGLNGVL